jgi:putative transposase
VKALSEDGYPVQLGCDLLELAHSSYYYHRQAREDAQVVEALTELSGQFPTYGQRRLTAQLRRKPYELAVNHKRVQRLMREQGLLRARKRVKYRTTNSHHPYPRYPNRVKDLVIDTPDQVWVGDITYIHLGSGFVFLAVLMDVFTRSIRGWALSQSLDGALTLAALHKALEGHCPQIHHSDQGFQYAAATYIALLQAHGVQISMAAVGQAEENGYAERLMRTIKEEEVELSEYRDFSDAQQQISHFIDQVYGSKRIHSALGYLTPAEFEVKYRSEIGQPEIVTNP